MPLPTGISYQERLGRIGNLFEGAMGSLDEYIKERGLKRTKAEYLAEASQKLGLKRPDGTPYYNDKQKKQILRDIQNLDSEKEFKANTAAWEAQWLSFQQNPVGPLPQFGMSYSTWSDIRQPSLENAKKLKEKQRQIKVTGEVKRASGTSRGTIEEKYPDTPGGMRISEMFEGIPDRPREIAQPESKEEYLGRLAEQGIASGDLEGNLAHEAALGGIERRREAAEEQELEDVRGRFAESVQGLGPGASREDVYRAGVDYVGKLPAKEMETYGKGFPTVSEQSLIEKRRRPAEAPLRDNAQLEVLRDKAKRLRSERNIAKRDLDDAKERLRELREKKTDIVVAQSEAIYNRQVEDAKDEIERMEDVYDEAKKKYTRTDKVLNKIEDEQLMEILGGDLTKGQGEDEEEYSESVQKKLQEIEGWGKSMASTRSEAGKMLHYLGEVKKYASELEDASDIEVDLPDDIQIRNAIKTQGLGAVLQAIKDRAMQAELAKTIR